MLCFFAFLSNSTRTITRQQRFHSRLELFLTNDGTTLSNGYLTKFIFFQGEERTSEVTGQPEIYYPEWKRNAVRYGVTVPIITVCLLVVFVTVFLILELQVKSLNPDYNELASQTFLRFQQWWDVVIETQGYFQFLRFLPKILLAMVIPFLDGIYNKIAVWLNDLGKRAVFDLQTF